MPPTTLNSEEPVIPGFAAAGAPTVEFLAGCEAFLFRHGFHSFMWVYEPYRNFEEQGRPFGNLWKTRASYLWVMNS